VTIENLSFRLINSQDKVEEINSLLRSAYSELAAAGMRYAASHEDVESTRKNIAQGECHLVLKDARVIGCCLLRRQGSNAGPSWYLKKEVATFGRFAIDPLYQGRGLGSKFLSYIEKRARELHAKELALDTSEKALHLIRMYEKRGYRFIEFHQWDITNYRSVVMSKILLE
jgi:GNAT superfamily N-acetyltransferase